MRRECAAAVEYVGRRPYRGAGARLQSAGSPVRRFAGSH